MNHCGYKIPISENMMARLKKILASRYFGVLTMLPTPNNAASTAYNAANIASGP
jgi:hypothetical protein